MSFAPKRGRPTASQSAAIERSIREAAAQTFLSVGYEGTSMETVAALAGVPKSTLYRRYTDKRALLRAVLHERVSAWRKIKRAAEPGDELEVRIKQLASEILERVTTPEVQAYWGLASAAWHAPDEAAERYEAIGFTHMMAELEREILELGPSSGIEVRNSRQVVTVIMAMLGGWIEFVAATSTDPVVDARTFAHSAVEILMHGSAAW